MHSGSNDTKRAGRRSRNKDADAPLPRGTAQVFEEARNIAFDKSKLTPYVSVDCEMVMCDKAIQLGRVTVVNESGEIVLDKYVRPNEPVTNYLTHITGITAAHLEIGEELDSVSDELYEVLSDHIMVGHSLQGDIKVLFPDRPPPDTMQIRDLSECPELKHLINKRMANGYIKTPSLRELSNAVLGRDIQCGMHSSLEDARAAMEVFLRHKDDVERPPVICF